MRTTFDLPEVFATQAVIVAAWVEGYPNATELLINDEQIRLPLTSIDHRHPILIGLAMGYTRMQLVIPDQVARVTLRVVESYLDNLSFERTAYTRLGGNYGGWGLAYLDGMCSSLRLDESMVPLEMVPNDPRHCERSIACFL